MTLKGRTRRMWPAAVPTGDLASCWMTPEPRPPGRRGPQRTPGEPWWHVPASWLLCGLGLGIMLAPICWMAVRFYDLSLGVCP